MTNPQVEVPEEAVEAALHILWDPQRKFTGSYWERVSAALQAAAPHIRGQERERCSKQIEEFVKAREKDRAEVRQQERERVREVLLSKEALQAGADAICLEKPATEAERNEVRIEIEAALDTLEETLND